jgi:uncharacterized protein
LDFLLYIIVGAVSGVVAALLGVGGGIVMVPVFVLLFGLSQKQAVATSLAAIIMTAAVATLKNQANSLINWGVALPVGMAAAGIAWFAADWLRQLSNVALTRMFAAVLIVVGLRMLFCK